MAVTNVPSRVVATLNYFSRHEKFRDEKPYTTSFPVDHIQNAEVSNHMFDTKSVEIHDVRHGFSPSLDVNGFMFLTAPTSLSLSDFDSRETVQNRYFSELSDFLQSTFPQYSAFAFFDYEVRKRSSLYPTHVGVAVDFAQPLAEAHVDYTPDGARRKLEAHLPQAQKKLLSKPCDLLNIWRTLKGPNDDWPLCLCDFQTIDPANDVMPNDIVYENSVGEDAFLLSNPSHKWYYMSGQNVEEVIVWRNTDIPDGKKPRAFHLAFENPLSKAVNGSLRQSIEAWVPSEPRQGEANQEWRASERYGQRRLIEGEKKFGDSLSI